MKGQQAIIVGAGRLGQTIGSMLVNTGVSVRAVTATSSQQARDAAAFVAGSEPLVLGTNEDCRNACEAIARVAAEDRALLLFITVSDDALEEITAQLAESRISWQGTTVFHCSGGLEVSALSPFSARGARTGVLHPCYPVYQPAEKLPGGGQVAYTFTGAEEAKHVAKQLVSSWEGELIELDGSNRALYHAGTVMAAGHLVALLGAAAELVQLAGVSPADAERIIRSVSSGVSPNRPTGPFVRGDRELIEKHRMAILEAAPEFQAIYDALGELSRRMLGK